MEASRIQVDGELFEMRPGESGGTHYAWLTGPNGGYGFTSSLSFESFEDHQRSIRVFLSMVDAETGYIEDEGPVPDPRLSEAVVQYVWGDGSASSPAERPDAVEVPLRRFLPRIGTLISQLAEAEPPLYLAGSVSEVAAAVRTLLEDEHPDLDDAALKALVDLYCSSWR